MTDRRSEFFSPRMLPSDPFADTPTLAELATPGPGSPAGAAPPRRMRGFNPNPFASRVFSIREVVVGYVSPDDGADDLPIMHASALEGDQTLARTPLTVTLDRFYVQEYPGIGTHQVLCTFTVGCLAKFDGRTGEPVKQDVTFGYTFPVGDQQAAAISGMPIFRDLRITDGLYMWVSCINTSSGGDDALLQALGADPFSRGLQLLSMATPLTGMVSMLVTGVAKHYLQASRDALTFKTLLGLQITGGTATGKLREGSYVIAQAGINQARWTDYRWRRSEGRVVSAADGNELHYNYLVI